MRDSDRTLQKAWEWDCGNRRGHLGAGGRCKAGEVVAFEEAGERLQALDVLWRHGPHHDGAPVDAEVRAVQRPRLLACIPSCRLSQNFPTLSLASIACFLQSEFNPGSHDHDLPLSWAAYP